MLQKISKKTVDDGDLENMLNDFARLSPELKATLATKHAKPPGLVTSNPPDKERGGQGAMQHPNHKFDLTSALPKGYSPDWNGNTSDA